MAGSTEQNARSAGPSGPEREAAPLLVELLLGDGPGRQRAGELLGRGRLWPAALQFAELWRVLPQLRRRAGDLGPSLEPRDRERLDELAAKAGARSRYAAERAGELMETLARSRVPAAAFKGIAVMALLLEDPAERMVHDIDLLVREPDLDRCFDLLGQSGFAPSPPVGREEFAAYLDNIPLPAHRAFVFVDRQRLQVDLHSRLGLCPAPAMEVETLLRRSETASLLGRDVAVVSPLDGMLLTVEHALRDRLAPWPAVKDLCDVALWLERRPELRAVGDWLPRVQECRLAAPLLALCRLLASLDPGSPARSVAAELASALPVREHRWAGQLEELFWLQVREGPIHRDLAGLLSLRSLGRFLLGRLRNRSANRQMRQSLRNPDSAAASPGQRLLHLLRQLCRLTPRRILLVRSAIRQHRAVFSAGSRPRPA